MTPERREPSGVTQAQFFEAHQQVMKEIQDLHRSQGLKIDAVRADLVSYTLALVPQVAAHSEKLTAHENRINEAEDEIKDVAKKSAFVSGIGAILAIAVGLLPLPWKH